MKNFINSTRSYSRTTNRTFSSHGYLNEEIQNESYIEFKTIEQAPTLSSISFSRYFSFFNKLLNLILKVEGLISFCCYLKEPAFISFLLFIKLSITQILNV